MKLLKFILLLVNMLPLTLTGELSVEERHEEIQKKLKTYSHLPYPYFAPSVHIAYHHPENEERYFAYYNEITVKETFEYTYFCAIGFDKGYLGIQDHGANGTVAIFSVWDKGGGKNDDEAVSESDRTQVIYSNRRAESNRFGGEGSGAKTIMPYKWRTGVTYSFLVSLSPRKQGTVYTAWIAKKGQAWKKIASYQTVDTHSQLRGFYSFIEDYVRNGDTGQSKRIASYPFQAAMNSKKEWQPITSMAGTIADDIVQNGHSGILDNIPYSETGANAIEYDKMPKFFRVKKRISIPFDFPDLPKDFAE